MTAETDIAEARKAFAVTGRLCGDAGHAQFERLGGLTNRVFKVSCGNGNFCLRLPGAGTEVLSIAPSSERTPKRRPKPASRPKSSTSATTA